MNRLQALIEEAGFTRASFGRAYGTSWPAVDNWCTGKTIPGMATVAKIASVLQMDTYSVLKALEIDAGTNDISKRTVSVECTRSEWDVMTTFIPDLRERAELLLTKAETRRANTGN